MIEPLLAGRLIGGRGVHMSDVPGDDRDKSVRTAIGPVDQATGGLPTGSVWTVVGPAGAGVSAFVIDLAAGVAHRDTSTLVVNGHLRSPVVVARARRALERIADATAATHLASWWPLPWPDGLERDDWHADGSRVLVLDTVDEMVITHARLPSPPEWLRMLRHLRRRAEQLELTVLLTLRLPADATTHRATRAALGAHPLGEALIDVPDVVAVLLRSSRDGVSLSLVHNRLGPPTGPVRIGSGHW